MVGTSPSIFLKQGTLCGECRCVEAGGHGVGIHPYSNPAHQPAQVVARQTAMALGPALATSRHGSINRWELHFVTVRTHTVAWQCWSDAASIEANAGMQMDTNFYAWGPWLKKPTTHGRTASSMQRLADANG